MVIEEGKKKMNDRLKKMWAAQRGYSELLYDVGDMDEDTREAKTRELALALHHEVSKLVSAVNFRGHRMKESPADRDRVLYEAVDAVRYAMAIANLWDFDDVDFEGAWWDKDAYLNTNFKLAEKRWDGRPVLLVDIDDVLAKFREGFSQWVIDKKGIPVDPQSKSYFFIEELDNTGYSSIGLYEEFIRERQVAELEPDFGVDVINRLHDEGAWIQLITARPGNNLICRYDTYHWLRRNDVQFDALAFTGEKLAYATRTQYCVEGKIAAAIDDGPNHVRSYAAHGVTTLMPVKSYNASVQSGPNVLRYTSQDELYQELRALIDHGD